MKFINKLFRCLFLALLFSFPPIFARSLPLRQTSRAIELVEHLKLSLPRDSRTVKIWIPVPSEDSDQRTEILGVRSPVPYRLTKESEFGNRLLFIESRMPSKIAAGAIQIRYRIIRREKKSLEFSSEKKSSGGAAEAIAAQFLKSRGLELINEQIQKTADESTKNLRSPIDKAKALYEYVLKHMRYDKSGTGWGRGDSAYACEIGKGNCTDFHSFFISLARAAGIPARFQMGFSLPRESRGEPLGRYHCWAEFYAEPYGWIPVDISEAWKHPEKAEYFFGNLDANRVLLTTGRQIELSPKQDGEPLNYLSEPYIEIDSRPYFDFEIQRKYRDLDQQSL